ncbi:MAG: M15 family metallopeptidase [Oscillospiraceae bacterium]|nr:M15 family metallopeptidase [Oscillospiraceae bacterium]
MKKPTSIILAGGMLMTACVLTSCERLDPPANTNRTSESRAAAQSTPPPSEPDTTDDSAVRDSSVATEPTGTNHTTGATAASGAAATHVSSAASTLPPGSELPVCKFEPMLVNARNPLPANYAPNLMRLGAYNGEDRFLHADAAPFAVAMVAAAKANNVNLTYRSTHRTVARQDANFRNSFQSRVNNGMSREDAFAATAAWIAPPGTSEHNAGIAIDFNLVEERFENTAEFKWLMANAHNYGFILRYPNDTRELTGINYEPWHFTFVGVNYAPKIRESGLVLEQWLAQNGTACRQDESVVDAFKQVLVSVR